jgi:hypothetical protein
MLEMVPSGIRLGQYQSTYVMVTQTLGRSCDRWVAERLWRIDDWGNRCRVTKAGRQYAAAVRIVWLAIMLRVGWRRTKCMRDDSKV